MHGELDIMGVDAAAKQAAAKLSPKPSHRGRDDAPTKDKGNKHTTPLSEGSSGRFGSGRLLLRSPSRILPNVEPSEDSDASSDYEMADEEEEPMTVRSARLCEFNRHRRQCDWLHLPSTDMLTGVCPYAHTAMRL